MNKPLDDRLARAAKRVAWPVRKFRMDAHPANDANAGTPAQRLAMMWPLALEAWSFAGRELPAYTRAETPIRVIASPRSSQGGSSSD